LDENLKYNKIKVKKFRFTISIPGVDVCDDDFVKNSSGELVFCVQEEGLEEEEEEEKEEVREIFLHLSPGGQELALRFDLNN